MNTNSVNKYKEWASIAKFDRSELDERCRRCNLIVSKAQKMWCWLPEFCGKSKLVTVTVSPV
jgi:hypothetical protein